MPLTPAQRTVIETCSRDETALQQLIALFTELDDARRHEHTRFQALFERTNDAIVFIGEDDLVIDANQAAADMLGYGLDELRGIHASVPVAPEERDEARHMADVLATGTIPPVYERTFIRKDGTPVRVELNIAMVYDDDGNPLYTQSIARNVAERKALEEELRRERNLLRTVVEAIPDPIYAKDRESRFTLVNRALRATDPFVNIDSLIGKTDLDMNWQNAEGFYAEEQRLMASGERIVSYEFHYAPPSDPQTEAWAIITKVPLYDDNGECIGLVGINRDITAIKKLERDLRDERNLLRNVIDAIPDPIYVKDRQSRIILVNQADADAAGLPSPDILIGKTDLDPDLGTAPDAGEFFEAEQQLMQTGSSIINQEHRVTTEGSPMTDILITKVPLRDQSGQIIGLIGINRDITAIKKLERDLRAERNLLRTVMDTIPDSIYVKDRDSRFTMVNANNWRAINLPNEEAMLGKTDLEVFADATYLEAQSLFDAEQHMMKTGSVIVNMRVDVPDNTSGGTTSLLISKMPLRDENGEIIGLVGINRDVTDRLRLEDELREERNLLRSIIDTIPDDIYVKDRQGRFMVVNHGRDKGADTLIGRSDFDRATPDAEFHDEIEKRILDTGEPLINFEYLTPSLGGRHRGNEWITITKVPLRSANGEIIGIIGVNHVITSLKKLQEELTAERNLLRSLIDAIPDDIYVKDRSARFILVNSHADAGLQALVPGSPIGRSDFDYRQGDAAPDYRDDFHVITHGETLIGREIRVPQEIVRNGIEWMSITKVPLRDQNGEIIGLVGINRDITPLKNLQEELTAERNLLRSLIDAIPEEIYVKDRESRFVLANSAEERTLTKLLPGTYVGRTDLDYFNNEQAKHDYEVEQEVMRTGTPLLRREYRVPPPYNADGVSWIGITKVPLRNADGDIIGLIGINHNITLLKQLQEDLTTERNLLRNLIDAVPVEIYIKDRDSRFTLVNRACQEQFGMTSERSLIGKTDADFSPENADEHFRDERSILENGETVEYTEHEIPDVYATPDRRWLTITKLPLRNADGTITGIIGINHNITPIKKLQEELTAERNLLRSLIDAVPSAIYIKDRQARFILVNTYAARSMEALVPGSPIGRTDLDYFGEHAHTDFEVDQQVMETGKTLLHREFEIPHEYETPFGKGWVSITKVPLRDASGQIVGLIGVNHDITPLKQLQEELAAERNLLRSIIDTIPDSIYVKDREARFMVVNARAEQGLMAYKPGSPIGRTDFDYHGEKAETDYRDDMYVMENSSPMFGKEVHGVSTADPTDIRWLSITKVPLHNADGQVIGIVGINRDITALKRLQQELTTERNLLRTVIDAIPEEVYVKDREMRFTLLNRASLEQKVQFGIGNPIGKTDADLFPVLADVASSDEQHILTTGESIIYNEYLNPPEYRTPERKWLKITKVPLRDDNGNIVGVVGLNHNITRTKDLEESLREERNLLRSVIDAIPDEVYVKNTAGQLVLINRSVVAKMGNMTAADMLGKTDFELYDTGNEEHYRDEQRIIQTGEPMFNKEYYSSGSDNILGEQWLLISKVPLRSADGEITGIIGINHYITPLKQLEQKLREERNLLRSVIDAIPDDIYVKDRSSRFIMVNQALVRKMGLQQPEQMIGKTDFEFIGHRAFDFYREEQRIMQGNNPVLSQEHHTGGEFTVIGEEWLVISKLPLCDETGEVVGLIGINHNVTPLKRYEQRLREERNLLRSIIDNIPDEVYVKDRQGRFLVVNQALLDVAGLDADSDIVYKTDAEIYGQDVSEANFGLELEIMETAVPMINREFKILDRFVIPERKWVLVSKVPLYDAKNRIIGLIGINHNVTRMKELEESLREERNLLRSIIDAIPDEIYVKDRESRFILVNRATLESYNYQDYDDLIGTTDTDLSSALDKAFSESERRLLETGLPIINMEHQIQLEYKTNALKEWLLITKVPLHDASGNIIGLIGVNRDITSIKRSQEAVRESEARLRTVAANLPNGTLLLVDADMRILVADGLNFRRNGYHPEKVVGQTIMEAFSNTIGKMSEIILRETFNGQPQTGEFMTDDLRIVSYLTQPIYGANDEIVSALAITQDVTEERKAQAAAFEVESLRVAMSKEQELNDLKTRMMIRISHEFRTPLSVISTSSEMIQRYFERMDANRRAEHFAQIQDQIMRIAAMLDDITLIMRVQTSGRITRSLDLSTAVRIQDACDEVLRTEPGSEDIQFEYVEGVPSIEGDHEMILRMVRALVSNAIKYSPVGSPVHLGLTADAEVVHITVSDSGSGIPEADLPRIFEPFYRGSNIDEVQGIGLGLSIVEAVVNLHNGNVEVDTVQGEGTTISVRLPYR